MKTEKEPERVDSKLTNASSKIAVDKAVALAAHQLKTPLAAIKGAIDLLVSDILEFSADHADLIKLICRNTDRSIRLVENLLLLSRAEKRELELRISEFTPAELLREVVFNRGNASLARGVDFEVVAGAANCEFRGDRELTLRLLGYLVENAAQFATPGTVTTLSWQSQAMAICFSVSDQGPGIPADAAKQIFEPFYRKVHHGDLTVVGDGLGLAVAKALAQLLGGELSRVDNDSGGSTFRVDLPVLSVT
ncbi:MAG: HAMP domain-containing sensor histidine kinase [Planctomycetota bacterium]